MCSMQKILNPFGKNFSGYRSLLPTPSYYPNFLFVNTYESKNYKPFNLGFFTTFTDDFPPNLAMLDQVEAIKFVKEEVSNFGGDPNRITLFGQSAGASSVSAHTYSPLTKGMKDLKIFFCNA